MGDSVGAQLLQALKEAMGADPHARKVIRCWWGKAGHTRSPDEGLHVSAIIQGAGVMAGWRVTGTLGGDGENKRGPDARCGGWSLEDSCKLLRQNWLLVGEQGVDHVQVLDFASHL